MRMNPITISNGWSTCSKEKKIAHNALIIGANALAQLYVMHTCKYVLCIYKESVGIYIIDEEFTGGRVSEGTCFEAKSPNEDKKRNSES